MFEFFFAVAEALGSYFAAIGVYMLLVFAITRLGRKQLLLNGSTRPLYTVLNAAAWCLAAAAGAFLCCRLAPLPPYGVVGFPLGIAVLLTLVLLRNFRLLPGQMSIGALGLNFLGISAGTLVALYAAHAFRTLHSS